MNMMAQFISISAEVSSRQNGATANYSFSIIPAVSIKINDTLTIQLVNDSTIDPTNYLAFNSTIKSYPVTSNATNASINTSYSVSQTSVTITFLDALSDTTRSTQYTLVISSVKLARTFKPSSSFNFTSKTQKGY
jgi:hypothetical protein